MEKISVIRIDLAKNMFHIHSVDATGEVVRKKLRRA